MKKKKKNSIYGIDELSCKCKAIAQDDSLKYSSVKIDTVDNTHNLKLKQFIVPTVFLRSRNSEHWK